MVNSVVLCFALILMPSISLGFTPEQSAKIRGFILEDGLKCINEYPLNNEDIQAFRAKKMPTGDNAGCFAACMFKASGLMDENGNISGKGIEERAKTIFNEDKDLKNLEEYISSCVSVNDEKVSDGIKGCDRAILAFNCLAENSVKFGYDFSF